MISHQDGKLSRSGQWGILGGVSQRWGWGAWEGAGRSEDTGTPVGRWGASKALSAGEIAPLPFLQSALTSGFHLSSFAPVPVALSKGEWLLIRLSRNDRNSPTSSVLGSGSHCRLRPWPPILDPPSCFPCSLARPFGAGAVSPHVGTCDPWWVWGAWPSPPAGHLLHR